MRHIWAGDHKYQLYANYTDNPKYQFGKLYFKFSNENGNGKKRRSDSLESGIDFEWMCIVQSPLQQYDFFFAPNSIYSVVVVAAAAVNGLV